MKLIQIIVFLLLGAAAFTQNIPHPNVPAPQGLSVNSFTGNLFYQRNEQSLRGTGYRIYQSFYYNAATDTSDYGYGHGWSFYYNIFYITKGSDTVIIQQSDAKKDTFVLSGGSYRSPVGVYDVLTKSGSAYILTAKDGKKEWFENALHKKITRMTDPNSNSVVLEYTGNYPTKIRNSSGRCLLLDWAQDNHLADAKDSAYPAKQFSYHYDDNYDLTEVVNPLANKISFTYTTHILQRMADENNNPVVITYAYGNVVKSINSCGTEQDFTFDAVQHRTYVTQKAQAGSILNGYYFDSKGKLLAMSDANGIRMNFTYDANNNLTSWQDFKGQTTTYQYDGKGNLLKETDPQGNSNTYIYEPNFNKISSVKDKRGNTTSFAYDAKGNLITVTQPGNITQSFTYDANGRILTATNANGKITTYQYNSNGDLTAILYPVGSVQFDYNGSCCEVGKITDANGNTQEMTYDLMNRLTSVTDKTGNTIQYDYDPAGNITRETDPNNITKQYGYDALNRLSSVTLKAGTWYYEYDEQSNLVKVTDANGHNTQYSYDNKNRLVKETDAIGNSTAYAYDANGNLVTRTDPNGNTVAYKYDELNRLIQKAYAGNTDNYSYDAAGNLTSAFNNNITYTFDYDNLNRLLKKNIPGWSKAISYTYDAAGNRKTMTDQDGGVTNYVFDGNNRLASLTNASNLITSFTYDAGGRILRQDNANGTFTTYHYDAAGRMDSLTNWQNSSTKISFFYYTFDKYGNRLTMRDKHGLNTYTYDSSYRLTKVVYGDGSVESFVIDPTGNRTLRIKNGDTTRYTYNSADQIQNAGISNFAFDANGNTTQQNDTLQRSYLYDGENRLLEVGLNPQKKVQYLYDPFGNKIQMIDTLSAITKMMYDGDNLLSELSSSNSTLTNYTSALDMDKWISMKSAAGNFFYEKDGINSVTELTNGFGITVNDYNYDIYGNIINETASIQNNILYTGRLYDRNIKLYDYRSRIYNPLIGRFVIKDENYASLSNPLSVNKYSYVENSPINFVDPYGRGILSSGFFFTAGELITAYATAAVTVAVTGAVAGYVGTGVVGTAIIGTAVFGSVVATQAGIGAAVGVTETLYDYIDDYINKPEERTCLAKLWKDVKTSAVTGAITNVLPLGKGVAKIAKLTKYGKLVEKYIGEKAAEKIGSYASEQTISGIEKAVEHFEDDPCKPKPENGTNNPTTPNPNKPNGPTVEVITPGDPNYLTGTKGYDTTRRWVSIKDALPYKASFENDPEIATAPAQRVTIYVPVNDKLDPNSVRLGDFGFGPYNFSVPANTSFYSNRLDVRDSLGVFVDVTAGLDIPNRRLFWIFQSVDPATGLTSTLPANAGFLPVNDSITHKGEGYVNFTLQPAATDTTADTTSAYASIIFDNEAALSTNTWFNTVDAVAPTSAVTGLQPLVDSVFTVSWSGRDDNFGSGVKNYDLYSSKNGGAFTLYRAGIDSTSATFTGDPGASYSFYTLATDNTGNKEAAKTAGEGATTVRGNAIFVSLKAFLGGAYQFATGLMTDSLRTKGLLPLTPPYKSLGFVPVNNSNPENITAALLDSTGTSALVDWVWLELRSSADPKQVIATRSAFIRRDGRIVDVDGSSPVFFPGTKAGSYYIAIRHRNHLGVMTAAAVSLTKDSTVSIDFTNPLMATYGTNVQQNIGGIMTMWAGDANGNGNISYNGSANDKNAILLLVGLSTSNNIITAYSRADCNLDGKVSYNGAANDKNKVLGSVGLTTPNNIITEQLPK